MITILLVCIFYGINVKLTFISSEMKAILEVRSIFDLNFLRIKLILHNRAIFYTINDRNYKKLKLAKNKNKGKNSKIKKIAIDNLTYSVVLGCKNNCLNGVYKCFVASIFSDILNAIALNYFSIDRMQKNIIPNFKSDDTIIMINLTLGKGIIDIIINILKNRGSRYANRKVNRQYA